MGCQPDIDGLDAPPSPIAGSNPEKGPAYPGVLMRARWAIKPGP